MFDSETQTSALNLHFGSYWVKKSSLLCKFQSSSAHLPMICNWVDQHVFSDPHLICHIWFQDINMVKEKMLLQKAMWLQMDQINYKNRIISFVSTLSIKFFFKNPISSGLFHKNRVSESRWEVSVTLEVFWLHWIFKLEMLGWCGYMVHG